MVSAIAAAGAGVERFGDHGSARLIGEGDRDKGSEDTCCIAFDSATDLGSGGIGYPQTFTGRCCGWSLRGIHDEMRVGDKGLVKLPALPLSYRTVDGGPGGTRTRDLVIRNDVVPPAFAS